MVAALVYSFAGLQFNGGIRSLLKLDEKEVRRWQLHILPSPCCICSNSLKMEADMKCLR